MNTLVPSPQPLEPTLVPLEPNEEILLTVHRHMFVFYASVTALVGLLFLPLFFSPVIVIFIERLIGVGTGSVIFGFFFALWLLGLWVVFMYRWTDYYLDIWIITNKRVFDIEQKGFFERTVSACRIEKVQDVSIEVKGVMATFFRFGAVHIHTAGERRDFSITNAADPADVKQTIMEALGKTMNSGHGLNDQV